MIIWLNGPFGAGKSTAADLMLEQQPDLTAFDTEALGYVLRPVLSARRPVVDFQDWPAWRRVVVTTLSALDEELDGDLVVPQTIVVEAYWNEIMDGLEAAGHDVRAFTLHVEPREHERRIARDWRDRGAARWRRERRADYDAARPWLEASTTLVDTTGMPAVDVARSVLASIGPR